MPNFFPYISNNKVSGSLSEKQIEAFKSFTKRVVLANVEPQGNQFCLPHEKHELLMSAEFVAYVRENWDSLKESHPCYQNDSGLCMATLWDNFEDINNNQYVYA